MKKLLQVAFIFLGLSTAVFAQGAGQLPNNSVWGNTSGSTAPAQAVTTTALLGSAGIIVPPQGRLTLQANTPVMITTQSAQTTLRYDCYNGSSVPYYNGTSDQLDTIASCEVTDAMVSAASAGQVVSGQVYDVWWVHSGANRICIAMSASGGGGGGWASDSGSATARGTGFTVIDRSTRPYATNKNSLTNCFNGATNYGPVSANQGTYLGTVEASANGQVSYTFGSSASGGGAALFGVWNMYNRVSTSAVVTDSGTTYTYTTATIREARGSTTNIIQYVLGLAEDGVSVSLSARATTTAATSAAAQWGIGYNSTTAFAVPQCEFQNTAAVSVSGGCTSSVNFGSNNLGFNTISSNELGDGTNANTFDVGTANTLTVVIRN